MATANRTFRSTMLLSTAMAALVAVPGVAHAQLVTSGDLVDAIDSGGNPGQLTVTDTSPIRTDMRVLAPVVVANWNRFNVPTGTTVAIANGTANPTATLVNRVIGATASDISGTISAPDINLWLINQNGILFGSGAAVNSKAFFASTLDVSDQDLFDFYEGTDLTGNGATTLRFNGSLGNGIVATAPNVSFVTDGSMMFVSEHLNLDATFNAGSGGVSFVAASDVNVTFTPGSPLSYVLNAGTTVAEQTIAGSVTGRSIDIQMLTATGVVGALLKVDAALNATAATPTANGIRLFAEQSGTASVTVEMTGGISSTGLIDLRTDGTLSSTSAITGSGVRVRGDTGVTVDDVTATNGAVTFNAGGNLTAGDVQATGNIFFEAGNLGNATFGSLISSGGNISVNGVVPSTITVTGITRGAGVNLVGINSVDVGDVVATTGSATLRTFFGTGPVRAGNVEGATGVSLSGSTIQAGNVLAKTGLARLQASGGITTASVTALAGRIDVDSTAGGTLNLGVLDASGNIDLDTTGALITAAITAGGNLTVGAVRLPGSVNFGGAVSAGSITVDTTGTFTSGSLTATTGNVDIEASWINAGNITANAGNVLLVAANNIATGTVRANPFSLTAGTIDIRSTAGGTLSLGDLAAGSNITLNTTGGILGAGAVSNGGALTIGGTLVPGDVTFTGNLEAASITVDALAGFRAGNITANTGNVDIEASRINAGDITARAGNVLLVAANNIATGAVRANAFSPASGTIDIRSTAGGTLSLGDLAAGSNITLNTTGGILGAGAVSNGGTLTIGGTLVPNAVTFTGNLEAASITVDALAGFTAGNITANTGDIDIDARSIGAGNLLARTGNVLLVGTNDITTGTITAHPFSLTAGTIAVRSTAGGTLNLGALLAGSDITLDTTGNVLGTSATSNGGALRIGGASNVNNIAFTGSLAARDVFLRALGTLATGDITATAGNIDVDVRSMVSGNFNATGGNVILLTDETLTTGNITATTAGGLGGSIFAQSSGAFAVSLGDLVATRQVILDGGLTIETGAITAGDGLGIGLNTDPTDVTIRGDVLAGAIQILIDGALDARKLTATNGAAFVSAGSINAGDVTANGGPIFLGALNNITTGALVSTTVGGVGGDIFVDSLGGGTLSLGNVTADANVVIDTTGAITAGNVAAGTGSVFIGAARQPALGKATILGNVSGQGVFITTAGSLDVGNVTATTDNVLLVSETITAGDITANLGSAFLQAVGDIRTGLIDVAGLMVVGSTGGGDLSLGNLIAGADIALDTTGRITTGAISADGALQVGSIAVNSGVTFGGDVSAQSIEVFSAGAVRGEQLDGLGNLVRRTNLTSNDGEIVIDADSIFAGNLRATGGSVSLLGVGDIDTFDVTAFVAGGNGGAIFIDTLNGKIDVGNLLGDIDIVLDAGGTIETDAIRSISGNLLVGTNSLPDSVTFNGNATAQGITVRTPGSFQARDLTATAAAGNITVDAATINAAVLRTGGGNVALTALRGITTDAITAGGTGAITVTSTGTAANAGNVTLGALQAGGNIALNGNAGITTTGTITSTGGALLVGLTSAATSVTFGGDATARAMQVRTSGAFRGTALTSTAGNTTVNAGSINTGAITATGGDVGLTAASTVDTGAITANGTGMITVTSTGPAASAGNVTLGALQAGGSILLNGNAGITTTGTITSTGGALLVGLSSVATSVTFGGDATARAIQVRTSGAFRGTRLTSTGGSTFVDAGSITTGAITSTGGNIGLVAVRTIDTGAITANGTSAITVTSTGTAANASNVTLGALQAGGDITLNGNAAITTTGTISSTGGALQVGFGSTPTSVTFGGNASAQSIAVRTASAFTGQQLTAATTIAVTSTGTGASAGNLVMGALQAGGNITLNGNGTIGTGAITSTGGALQVGLSSAPTSVTFGGNASAQSIAVRTASAFTGQQLTAATTIAVTSTGTGASAGNLVMGALQAGGDITLNGNAAVTTGAVTSTGGALRVGNASSVTAANFGGDVSARSIDVRSTGAVTAELRDLQGNLVRRTNLAATAGDTTINAASITTGTVGAAGGNVGLTASRNITTGAITATRVAGVGGAIRVLSSGTGANAGVLNLAALLADLGIELDAGGAINTGTLTARNGAVDVDGASIAITGASSATGGNVRLLASGAITTGALSATAAGGVGGAIDVDSTNGGAISTGALQTTGGGITLDTLGTVTTTGAVTSTGNLVVGADRRTSAVTLGGTVNAANVTLRSSGLSTTNVVGVGTGTVDIEAANIDLLGGVTAGSVILKSFNNGTIGLGSAGGTMALTDAELGRITAGRLLINAGTGNIGIAGVAFQPGAGSTAVDIATTGNIAITGNITGTGATRTFRLGGPATGSGTAARIIATVDTATINLGTAKLDLRGNDIVFGKTALIEGVFGRTAVGSVLTGGGSRLSIDELVRQFVANPQSALYTSEGLAADKVGKPFLIAGSMSVTYGGSALFQNTAPRTGGLAFEGVKLADAANPAVPALTLNPLTTPTAQAGSRIADGNVFSIFGTVNGAEGPAAALAGDTVITVNDKLLLPASRINGCIIGSAAGCVNTVIGNFVLTIPREVVLPIVADEGAPLSFDPLVGTNNESLFSDAATAPESDEACRERDAAGVCVRN